jgi:hypothetical protein
MLYSSLSIVPRIIYHPEPLNTSMRRTIPLPDIPPSGVWFICMEEIPGTSLDKVIHRMDSAQLCSIANQLRAFLDKMASIREPRLGSLSGEPYQGVRRRHSRTPLFVRRVGGVPAYSYADISIHAR